MRRILVVLGAAALVVAGLAAPSPGKDRPFDAARLIAMKLLPAPEQFDLGIGGGAFFSKKQVERFRCEGAGDPADVVDMSCNTTEFGQDYAPDNEIAIAVDPEDPDHLLAGSNDYYYRFNNASGLRQAIVPTGFFTSFDGGATWLDGQIPLRSGDGAGDPAPAFDAKHDVALMAQLENVGSQGGFWVAAGNVSVSRSTDGGVSWSRPVTVFKGTGAGIGPANQAVFWDKEFIAVDNYETQPNGDPNPYFGRIYVVASKFVNTLQGNYARSPIALSYSDDGGLTWSAAQEISGSHESCTFQETGAAEECDEDQFGYPTVAPDGTVYVHFHNYQNEAEWEGGIDLFDAQIMVVKSTDGGVTWSGPTPVVQLEDGYADMPFSVIRRQTIWGHQIRWGSAGNIAVDPGDSEHVAIVFSDRETPNPNASINPVTGLPCFLTATGGLYIGTAPNYDPCGAGPGSDTNVYVVESTDSGANWTLRSEVAPTPGHAWFPWADFTSDGTLVAAWDEDIAPFTDGRADAFQHVLWDGSSKEFLGSPEMIDVSVTHWAGQYTTAWPAVCGPADYEDPAGTPAEGKDCNIFHGDYTGLAVGPDDAIHVVWTGLNRLVTSPQVDFYTGFPHDGYAQDAMYAQR